MNKDYCNDKRFSDIKPFEDKIYLSSPTMHGSEMIYMKEAYDTNWMSSIGHNLDVLEEMMGTPNERRSGSKGRRERGEEDLPEGIMGLLTGIGCFSPPISLLPSSFDLILLFVLEVDIGRGRNGERAVKRRFRMRIFTAGVAGWVEKNSSTRWLS